MEQVNIDGIKFYSEMIKTAVSEDPPLTEYVVGSYFHLLEHPKIFSSGLGLSEDCHRHCVNAMKECLPVDKLLFENEIKSYFSQLHLLRVSLETQIKRIPTYDTHFDCILFERRKLVDNKFLPMILTAAITYLLNFWNDKKEVVLFLDENKKLSGDVIMQNLLVLASYIEDDILLEQCISSIINISNYKATIKSAILVEKKQEYYQQQVMESIGMVNNNPNIPFKYRDIDAEYIRNTLLNEESQYCLGRLYRTQIRRLVKVLT
jgi:hypothetical protein